MKLTLLLALGLVKAYDFERTEEFKAAELSCIEQLKANNGYSSFKFTQKEDGVYINNSLIKHWVGPVKREWNGCMKPHIVKAMEDNLKNSLAKVREGECLEQLRNNEGY